MSRIKNKYNISIHSYVVRRVGPSDKAIDFDGLIGLQLQMIDAKLLKDIVVYHSLRWGGLKLARTEFIFLLTTVVISSGIEKH